MRCAFTCRLTTSGRPRCRVVHMVVATSAVRCAPVPTVGIRGARRSTELLRALLHRSPVSTSSTDCSSTTAQPHCRQQCRLQGRLDGEHAHTVWIGDVLIRAERDRYRYVRDQPQPRCSPMVPGPIRCPTSRSRPARSPALVTPARPAASMTSKCSICSPEASPRTKHADWSSRDSSPSYVDRIGVADVTPAVVAAHRVRD